MQYYLTVDKTWVFRTKRAVNRVTKKRGKIGGNARVNSPKMFGLTEMSNVGGGWVVLRQNKLF